MGRVASETSSHDLGHWPGAVLVFTPADKGRVTFRCPFPYVLVTLCGQF
jgi:hypothetical protein